MAGRPGSHCPFLSHVKQLLLLKVCFESCVWEGERKHSFEVTRWLILFLRCVFLEKSWKPYLGRNSGIVTTNWTAKFTTFARISICRQEPMALSCPGGWVQKEASGPGCFISNETALEVLVSWQESPSQDPKPALAPSFPSIPPIPTYSYSKLCSHSPPLQLCPPDEEKLSCKDKWGPVWWQHEGTGYLQMADWLYAGPSVALRACPTWVCVRPRDRRRILKALANSRISSRFTPSTSPAAVWGSVEMFLKTGSICQHTSKQYLFMRASKKVALFNSRVVGKPTLQNVLSWGKAPQLPSSAPHISANHPSRYFHPR